MYGLNMLEEVLFHLRDKDQIGIKSSEYKVTDKKPA